MGLIVRNQVNELAKAVVRGLNDSRKHPAFCRGYASGSLTLVSGTLAVTAQGIPSNAIVRSSITAPGGTMGAAYKFTGIGTSGGFTVTAIGSTGSTVTTDTSTLAWEATWPVFHADQTPQYGAAATSGSPPLPNFVNLTVTAAAATTLPTTITLANQIRQVLNQHMADAVAHSAADTTNPVTAAVAVDQTTVDTLLNACATAFNAHLTQSGVHINSDTVNTDSSTTASNLSTSETMANNLKAEINLHVASAPPGESVTVIND